MDKQSNGSGNEASLFIEAVQGEPRVDIQEPLSTLGWEVTLRSLSVIWSHFVWRFFYPGTTGFETHRRVDV